MSVLAWIALVPLILACSFSTVWERCCLGWLAGAVALLGIHYRLFTIEGFGVSETMELVYAGFYLGWAAGLSWLVRTHCAVFPLACLWVVLEWLRQHQGFMANPFATLAPFCADVLSVPHPGWYHGAFVV